MGTRPLIRRKTAMRMVGGRPTRKNNHAFTARQRLVVTTESPWPGYRHVVTPRDVLWTLDLLDDLDVLARGLEAIVLTEGADGWDGLYRRHRREDTASIFLAAWPEDLFVELSRDYIAAHRNLFDDLGVTYDLHHGDAPLRVYFEPAQVRAYMLLHVLVHELGHHHDRLTARGRRTRRGERYAEEFALVRWRPLLARYIEVFGDPHPARRSASRRAATVRSPAHSAGQDCSAPRWQAEAI